MKNRLITDEQRKKWKKAHNRDYPEKRASGRSFGIAMLCIGKAMGEPGESVEIYDHYPRAERFVARQIEHIIEILGLKYLTLRKDERGGITLIYEVFSKEETA